MGSVKIDTVRYSTKKYILLEKSWWGDVSLGLSSPPLQIVSTVVERVAFRIDCIIFRL